MKSFISIIELSMFFWKKILDLNKTKKNKKHVIFVFYVFSFFLKKNSTPSPCVLCLVLNQIYYHSTTAVLLNVI